MNKFLLSLTLALGLFGIAQATVPQRRQFTHKQPDGTSLRLTSVQPDVTYLSTTDGLAVLRGTDGNFYYARLLQANGNAPRTLPTTKLNAPPPKLHF